MTLLFIFKYKTRSKKPRVIFLPRRAGCDNSNLLSAGGCPLYDFTLPSSVIRREVCNPPRKSDSLLFVIGLVLVAFIEHRRNNIINKFQRIIPRRIQNNPQVFLQKAHRFY